ncbi:bla regulator protein blaR1 [Paenibacillus sp. 1_12]|uniref:M56 family metallopeptidase n=1 Tax=Paenibacillus sp. 1_12 TaxID=1566278 RepID=UPI0008ECE3AD|nr:M56 family metallopeptidase [Paenibacillus sp. 1_12]SFL57663.1 bla regulator protein blaR1 [Paenibacillus sp. 1_12]
MTGIAILLLVFFNWVLSTSVMAAVFVGLIMLVKVILKDRLKPRWHYMLWILLILRIILPWTPESSFSVYNLFTLNNKQESTPAPHNINIITPVKDHTLEEMIPDKGDTYLDIYPTMEMNSTDQRLNSHVSTVTLWLFLLWLVGIVFFSTQTFLINRRFELNMRNESATIDPNILSIYNKCRDTLSIRVSIPIILSDKVSSPTLWGCLRPQIIIPRSTGHILTSDELRYILLHELIHLKRKDIVINWIMHALLILHWFNPILWFAYFRMREDQEIACDTLVLNSIEANESKEYAMTIIKLMESVAQRLQSPGIAIISGNKKQLKRRINMIKHFKKSTHKWSVLGLTVLILFSVAALTHAKGHPQLPEGSTSISQESTIQLMHNSLDPITTVRGKLIDSTSSDKEIVEFQVREGIHPVSYLNVGNHETIYTNGYLIHKINGEYSKMTYIGPPPLTPNEKKLPKVEQTPRRDPANSGIAETIIAPEQNAMAYLEDHTLWSVKGEDFLLGRPVIIISGDLSHDFKSKYDAKKFTMWVDKETGMLLKKEEYDNKGKMTASINVLEIEINPTLDETLFYITSTDFAELYKKNTNN